MQPTPAPSPQERPHDSSPAAPTPKELFDFDAVDMEETLAMLRRLVAEYQATEQTAEQPTPDQ